MSARRGARDERSEAEANADYEGEVERVFTSYIKKTRQPLAAEAKARLRERYGVWDRDENALLDLKNVLESAVAVWNDSQAKSVEASETKERKRSQKCFDRRYHMVAFVAERLRKSGTLHPDWKRLVAEWNAAHPSDQVTRDLLKVEYNRALYEPAIVFQYQMATGDSRLLREFLKRTKIVPPDEMAVVWSTWKDGAIVSADGIERAGLGESASARHKHKLTRRMERREQNERFNKGKR